MKYLILALLFAALASAKLTHIEYNEKYSGLTHGLSQLSEDLTLQMYTEFLDVYKNVPTEKVILHMERYPIFKSKLEKVIEHNMNPDRTYTKGITKFADLTKEEFRAEVGLGAPQNCNALQSEEKREFIGYPPSFDWRDRHMVTPVKDQGNCGSCYTFSTVGAMEAHLLIQTGIVGNFSEQQLVDCSTGYDNHGCEGGLPSNSFNYIRDNGLTIERSYDYTAKEGTCHYDRSKMARVTTSGPYNVTKGDEKEMADIIFNVGPVSCALECVDDFDDYLNGTYTSTTCGNTENDINHAVLCVGYGRDNKNMDFWAVKNSWSTEWGMNGYFNIQRNANMCGMAVCNSYPQHVRPIHHDVEDLLKDSI